MATLPDISPRGAAVIVRLERHRLWPGAVADLLDAWALLLPDPYYRLFDLRYRCGTLVCCPDPGELRAILEAVAYALPDVTPAGSGRAWRKMDEHW